MYAKEGAKHSLRKSAKIKVNDARKSDDNVMDHSGFDCKFDENFTDEYLGNHPHQQLSNEMQEYEKRALKKSHHNMQTNHMLIKQIMLRISHHIFKVK